MGPLFVDHAADAELAEERCADAACTTPSGCGVLRPALPNADDPGLPPLAADAIAGPVAGLAAPIAPAWAEPTWPPGILRALFQVYRI